MNYYEELGLGADATPEDIRAAYKSLVRLLHPDHQTDAHLKFLAECQMRRLNEIYEVLSDPVERRLYDARLKPVRTGWLQPAPGWRLREVGLVLAGAGLAVFATWTMRSGESVTYHRPPMVLEASPSEPPLSQPAVKAEPLQFDLSAARRELASLRRERDAALAELASVREQAGRLAQPSAEPSPHVPPPAPPEPVPPAAELTPAPEERTPARAGFGGVWVYVPPRLPDLRPQAYAAEYVEVVIVEEGGILRGRYRGRFRIPDRPISPEVSFRFEGRYAGGEANFPWTGPSGAKGEVNLRLADGDRLKLDWFATDLGSQLGLASGSALLTRRRAN